MDVSTIKGDSQLDRIEKKLDRVLHFLESKDLSTSVKIHDNSCDRQDERLKNLKVSAGVVTDSLIAGGLLKNAPINPSVNMVKSLSINTPASKSLN